MLFISHALMNFCSFPTYPSSPPRRPKDGLFVWKTLMGAKYLGSKAPNFAWPVGKPAVDTPKKAAGIRAKVLRVETLP